MPVRHPQLGPGLPLLATHETERHRTAPPEPVRHGREVAALFAVAYQGRAGWRQRALEDQAHQAAVHVSPRRAARDHLLTKVAALRRADRVLDGYLERERRAVHITADAG